MGKTEAHSNSIKTMNSTGREEDQRFSRRGGNRKKSKSTVKAKLGEQRKTWGKVQRGFGTISSPNNSRWECADQRTVGERGRDQDL